MEMTLNTLIQLNNYGNWIVSSGGAGLLILVSDTRAKRNMEQFISNSCFNNLSVECTHVLVHFLHTVRNPLYHKHTRIGPYWIMELAWLIRWNRTSCIKSDDVSGTYWKSQWRSRRSAFAVAIKAISISKFFMFVSRFFNIPQPLWSIDLILSNSNTSKTPLQCSICLQLSI